MKFSYIGLSRPMNMINSIIKQHINEFRRNNPGIALPLEPGGVFASNLSTAAAFAGDNDMCVHYTFNDLIKNSDIIFVFLPDQSLKKLSLSVAKYDVKNKIFCHANTSLCSDILDFSSYNTYLSILVTSFSKEQGGRASYGPILLEGFGRKFDEFTNVLNSIGINHYKINAEEKRTYLAGINFIKDFSDILDSIGKKLIKYSLAGVPGVYDNILELLQNNTDNMTSYNALEYNDSDYINRQNDLLDKLGIDNITRLYKAITTVNRK